MPLLNVRQNYFPNWCEYVLNVLLNCQEVKKKKKRSDLNQLHCLRLPSASLLLQLFWSMALAFRVAPYQVAVLNELLKIGCKEQGFFFSPALMNGNLEPRWSTQMSWKQAESSLCGAEWEITCRRARLSDSAWTLESTAVSWLHSSCHLFGSTNFERIWWKYLLLHQSLKLRKATFLLGSEQEFFVFVFFHLAPADAVHHLKTRL